jgi:hypothetical protein
MTTVGRYILPPNLNVKYRLSQISVMFPKRIHIVTVDGFLLKEWEYYIKKGGKWLLLGDMTTIKENENNRRDREYSSR